MLAARHERWFASLSPQDAQWRHCHAISLAVDRGGLDCRRPWRGSASPEINSPVEQRQAADDAFEKGNFKDALPIYQALAMSPNDDPAKIPHDLTRALACLQTLNRTEEVDDLREKVVALQPHNWRLLQEAAKDLYSSYNDFGFIIAGKFHRGEDRGDIGGAVNAVQRDWVRALQLMRQVMPDADKDPDIAARSAFYTDLAAMVLEYNGEETWKLQTLTDLSKLPAYEKFEWRPEWLPSSGAPVNEDGSPVFHSLPKSWDDAATDGQRWRWCVAQVTALTPSAGELIFAKYLHDQLDVQSLAEYGSYDRDVVGPRFDDQVRNDASGDFAVRTLGDDETIARLASGTKRFKLPEEYNFIHLFQKIAKSGNGRDAEAAINALAEIYENRRQFDRAADYWKKGLEMFGSFEDSRKARLNQILGNWAEFEHLETCRPAPMPRHHLSFAMAIILTSWRSNWMSQSFWMTSRST